MRVRQGLMLGAVGALSAGVLVGGQAVAAAVAPRQQAAVPVAAPADEPPSLVEDYSYPGAANIKDIELIKGDGRITLVTCDESVPQITVESVGKQKFCFHVKGDTGYLSLRLEKVFLIWAGDEDVAATVTAKGERKVVPIEEGSVESIGAGDPNFGVLLELRATP